MRATVLVFTALSVVCTVAETTAQQQRGSGPGATPRRADGAGASVSGLFDDLFSPPGQPSPRGSQPPLVAPRFVPAPVGNTTPAVCYPIRRIPVDPRFDAAIRRDAPGLASQRTFPVPAPDCER